MDVYIQTGHQSHCCRIIRYFEDESTLIFPKQNFGTQAVEVGPRQNKKGPCLVQILGVTVDPLVFLSWLQNSIIDRYVLRIYWIDPNRSPAASEEDLIELLKAFEPPVCDLRIQCNPKHLEQVLQLQLPMAWRLRPKDFEEILYVVKNEGKLFWSIQAAQTWYQNPTTHIQVKSASAAVHKLEEALQLAPIILDRSGIAIDLGAAPGGWTMLLAKILGTVLAVDNAELAAEALTPNVVHIRSLAQQAQPHILRYTKGKLADLMVCDMNMHICQAIHPIKQLVPLLKLGGYLIVTLKFFGVGRTQRKSELGIKEELRKLGFLDCKIVWCLANTVNERTLIAQKIMTV